MFEQKYPNLYNFLLNVKPLYIRLVKCGKKRFIANADIREILRCISEVDINVDIWSVIGDDVVNLIIDCINSVTKYSYNKDSLLHDMQGGIDGLFEFAEKNWSKIKGPKLFIEERLTMNDDLCHLLIHPIDATIYWMWEDCILESDTYNEANDMYYDKISQIIKKIEKKWLTTSA